MATDEPGADEAQPDPGICMACRGTGKVVSTLGGSPSEVDCPWCDGTGRRIPGHDAQTRWRERRASDGAPD